MLAPISLGLRALQFIFAVVVLGLAVTLIKAQVLGDAPTTTKYSSFTGAFGIIVCAAGVAGMFVSAIPDLVTMALDGVLALLFLAGGIAWAVGLKGIGCKDQTAYMQMRENGLLNEGSATVDGVAVIGADYNSNNDYDVFDKLSANCQKGMADEIMQFISFAFALGLLGLGFVRWRKGGTSGSSRYVA
ncbi:marvel domain-containing protein [Diplogelasinospora grovesii]|uniref:Marvel domain-containing protein n=1 Tax=Diplogelasinospora grovesii TaxID=303347 RepID=A0AAN6NAD3_9PEZI|nr:marvel domain-containing protein [Diplogelasinospora grovesii]